MITFSDEPNVFVEQRFGEQFPGLPGGVRFPALVGESQTYIVKENIPITKGGLLNFSYDAITGILTTDTAHGPSDIVNIVALRKTGTDFELVMPGNSTTTINISDVSVASADITQVRVGGQVFSPNPVPTTHTVTIDSPNPGFNPAVLTITAGDKVTWSNSGTLAHGIKNEPTSPVIFDSSPINLGPGDTFTPLKAGAVLQFVGTQAVNVSGNVLTIPSLDTTAHAIDVGDFLQLNDVNNGGVLRTFVITDVKATNASLTLSQIVVQSLNPDGVGNLTGGSHFNIQAVGAGATVFDVTGSFTYFDPLQPQNSVYAGVINVLPFEGYAYNSATKEMTFTSEVPNAKNEIEIDTKFATSSLPVTIRLDGLGITGPYDLNITPPQVRQILNVELIDIADPLPDTDVLEIIGVANHPFRVNPDGGNNHFLDYTPDDYILVDDTLNWGGAAAVTPDGMAPNIVASTSTEAFSDKIFVTVGEQLQVQDAQWLLTVASVGPVGVGTYTVTNKATGAFLGTFTASPSVVPSIPIPGINLIVIDTTGTTVGDQVLVTTHVGTANQPVAGSRYFVTYKVKKTDFRPKLFFRFADIRKEYGNIVESFNPDGSIRKINNLPLAAFLTLINGAPGVFLRQTAFGSAGISASADFQDAFDDLKEVDDIGTVVPLSSDPIVRESVQEHVNETSTPRNRRERMAFVSSTPGASLEELIGIAQGLADRRVAMITPTAAITELQGSRGVPTLVTVEGFFLAAAYAGLNHSQRFDVAEPMTRKRIVGFTSLLNEFTRPEKDRLSENGVLTIQTLGGAHSVRQSITTSINSIEEREISITKIGDFVARAVRFACDRFIGHKLVDETPIWVESAIANILQALVGDQIIMAFAGIHAYIDINRADTVQVEFSYKPIYPCNFIMVRMTLNSRL